jgi:hypothetical protein
MPANADMTRVLLLLLQVFLNMQDRQLALRGKSSWVQDYYMPAPCDSLVIAGAACRLSPACKTTLMALSEMY